MDSYKELGNISECIMIREMQKKLHGQKKDGKKREGDESSEVNKSKDEENRKIKCIFCGSKNNLHKYLGNYYCHNCYRELQKLSLDDC